MDKLGDRVLLLPSMRRTGHRRICSVREGYPTQPFDSASRLRPEMDKSSPTGTWSISRGRAVHTRAAHADQAAQELKDMALLRIGRLSVSPVTADEWR